MKQPKHPSPLTAVQVTDRYFLEHRAKLLDIAAYLDRVERAAEGRGHEARKDFRLVQFRHALALLDDGQGERTRRVLEIFSDPTTEPIGSAAGMKGASGAWPGAGKKVSS